MRKPLVVVTGTDRAAMDATLVSLAWDLDRAVSVRHTIDPFTQVLMRTVSDAAGVLEHEELQLEHACVSCALREDVLPTLDRLARDGRWSTLLCCLPVATEADQLVTILSTDPRLARRIKLAGVVAVVEGSRAEQDLLGEELLVERDLHSGPDDERGLAEVGCCQVELADLVVLVGAPAAGAVDLTRALARPGVPVLLGVDQLDGTGLAQHRREHAEALAWTAAAPELVLPDLSGSRAWSLDLTSPLPLHPDRLLDEVERLGSGPVRSRGSFWLPTRPGRRVAWSGAGGQLSLGAGEAWGRRSPCTRLVFTGLGQVPPDLAVAFREVLLAPADPSPTSTSWSVGEDGLEPWLGAIHEAA